MESKGLSLDSEKLLYEIVDAINPTQMLGNLFKDVAPEAKSGLRRLVKELQQYGYIDVVWADNVPCMVTLKSLAEKSKEQFVASKKQTIIQTHGNSIVFDNTTVLRDEEPKPISMANEATPKKTTSVAKRENAKPIIFISHRSTDKEVANMLADFFYGTGIPSDTVFCSSLPGNDVKKRISDEVKAALKASAVNIVILSRDYYQSAYCLQEAGVIWYRDDVPVVLVALPEINEKNIYGFFDKNDILRRLDSNTDILEIYDDVSKAVSAPHRRTSAIALKSDELMRRYAEFLKKRETPETETAVLSNDDTESKAVSAVSENHDIVNAVVTVVSENNELGERDADLLANIVSKLVTDDERIVLYYILKNGVCRASKPDINEWLRENEIHGVNVDNAFDLLSYSDTFTFSDNIFGMDVKTFREIMLNETSKLSILEECVNKHKKLASDTFEKLWGNDEMRSPVMGLFIAYIIDEKIYSFQNPILPDEQIESINRWEDKNGLSHLLSYYYVTYIKIFIENDLVYRCRWPVTEYHLYPSLQKLLFNDFEDRRDYLNKCKQLHKN